jgi:ketosteroid isomerase-like protein
MYMLLFFLLPLAVLAAGHNEADEKAVRAAVEAFDKAARSGDSAALNKLLADDLDYRHSNAKRENKQECIAALVASKPDFRIEPGWNVRLFGNTAVVHAKTTSHLNQNGKQTQVPLDMLQVWVKGKGGWQMVARHTTRLPAN